jgi:hypothetical protein
MDENYSMQFPLIDREDRAVLPKSQVHEVLPFCGTPTKSGENKFPDEKLG